MENTVEKLELKLLQLEMESQKVKLEIEKVQLEKMKLEKQKTEAKELKFQKDSKSLSQHLVDIGKTKGGIELLQKLAKEMQNPVYEHMSNEDASISIGKIYESLLKKHMNDLYSTNGSL